MWLIEKLILINPVNLAGKNLQYQQLFIKSTTQIQILLKNHKYYDIKLLQCLPNILVNDTRDSLIAIASHRTSKFECKLDNIRIEKMISAPIWVTNFF